MAEIPDSAPHEGLPPELADAVSSQSQIASAPAVQDANVVDSTTTEGFQQATPEPWHTRVGITGFEGVENEDAALERVRRIAAAGGQAYQQAQYYAQQNQTLQNQLQAFQAAQLQAQQAQAQPKPAAPKKPWDAVPYDDSYLEWIDPATKTWRENTPHNVVINAQKFARAQQEFINKMYTQPDELLAPYIAEQAKGLFTPLQEKLDALQARLDGQAQQQQIASVLMPYRDQLYAVDATGAVQKDQWGNPLLTSMGQSFNQFAAAAEQHGITDPNQRALFALLASQNAEMRARLSQAPAQPAAPQQTARQQHDQAIYANGTNPPNGVNRLANRGNTLNASQGVNAPLQNQHVSAEDLFRSTFRETFPNGIHE